ncbi:MAG: hypothetical protein ACF8TS_05645 [Maioricimonas sp. JB049]
MIRMLNLLAITAGLTPLLTAHVSAAEPMSMIPADAAVVVRLKAPEATTEKMAQYADGVQPGAGRNIRGNAAAIGLAISNPTLTGVDQGRAWLLTVLVEKGQQPQVVFLIPATDTEAMTSALPDTMTSVVHDDWVVYSEDAAALDAFQPEGESRFTATMGDASTTSFDKGDVSLFVNISRLTDVYADKIEQLREQATSALNQIQFNLANADTGMQMGPIFEMYGKLLEGSLQALDDARGLVVAISVDETALVIEEYFDFESGSSTGEWLGQHEGSNFPALGKLPVDAISYYCFSGDLSGLYQWSFGMTTIMLPEDDDDTREKLESLLDRFSEFEFGAIVGSMDLASGEDGAARTVNIVEVSSVERFRQTIQELIRLTSNLKTPGFRQTNTVAPAAETIDGHKVDVITVEQEFDEDVDPTGMQKKLMEILFGSEGIVSRQVFMDDRYVQTTGGGQPLMEEALSRIDGDESASYDTYRTGIVEEPNLLVLLDLPGLAVKGMKIAATVPSLNLPVTPEMVQGMASPPSYLTFAIKAEESALRCQTRLPVQQPQGIMRLVGLFVLLGQQIQQNGF